MPVTATQVGDGLGDFEMHPGKVAEACLDEWARVWKAQPGTPEENSLPAAWMEGLPHESLPEISVPDIRRALRKASGPGRGIDGWTRAELQALPDTGLAILAQILAAAEQDGGFPSCGGLGTVEVLLDKGGRHGGNAADGTLASYRAFTGSGAPPGVEWCEPGGPR